MADEILKRYTLLAPIGSGGMGDVFLARAAGEHGFEKTVAVKKIRPDLATDPEFVVRFVTEAKVAVSLSHANVVQVFDLARAGTDLFIVMEHVAGADLARILAALEAAGETMPLPLVLYLGMEVLKALAYAHERLGPEGEARGVVHCDISPQNLLVSYAGEVKVLDFGVAQTATLARRNVTGGRVMGKRRYMPPEQEKGEAVDGRADLFALAAVLRQASKGTVASDLDGILARALEPDPARRPASARAMLAELARVARVVEPPVSAPDVGTWVRRWVPPTATAAVGGSHIFPRRVGTATATAAAAPSAASWASQTFVARVAGEGETIWEPLAQKSKPRRRVALGVASVLVAVLGGATLLAKRSPPPPIAAPTPAPTPAEMSSPPLAAPSAAPSAAPARVERPTPTRPPRVRAASPAARGAFLNINADPWAQVSIDGRAVGVTPILKTPVAPGKHRVRLVHPLSGAVDRVVHVKAGGTAIVFADLDKK